MLKRRGSLLDRNPELSEEGHPTRNGDLTPDQVTSESRMKVWWKCSQGHEWEAIIDNRTIGHGCPLCTGKKASEDYNLAFKNPELTGEWHLTKNMDLKPSKVTPGSYRKVWWRCTRGHEWGPSPSYRTRGTGCPYCSG